MCLRRSALLAGGRPLQCSMSAEWPEGRACPSLLMEACRTVDTLLRPWPWGHPPSCAGPCLPAQAKRQVCLPRQRSCAVGRQHCAETPQCLHGGSWVAAGRLPGASLCSLHGESTFCLHGSTELQLPQNVLLSFLRTAAHPNAVRLVDLLPFIWRASLGTGGFTVQPTLYP